MLTVLTNNDNVVLDNLPIYFIWFGSDVPSKYFGNLLKAAETNKSRDIILVYSKKSLSENNRKNIDSLESISIDDIKTRVELKRDTSTQNLFEIDVYDMEFNKQDERIYDLFNKALKICHFYNDQEQISLKYCIASDLIRLPLLNITGGIYLDMDTEVIGEIGKIENKNGFSLHYYYDGGLEFTGNFLIKVNKKDDYFCSLIKQYFDKIENFVTDGFNNEIGTDPSMHLSNDILGYYLRKYINHQVPATMQGRRCRFNYHYDKRSKVIQYKLTTNDDDSHIFSFSFKGRDEIYSSYIEQQSIFNYGIHVPKAIKLNMKQGETYAVNHNDPEQLKKFDLDKQDDMSSRLETLSLGQQRNSQEKGR